MVFDLTGTHLLYFAPDSQQPVQTSLWSATISEHRLTNARQLITAPAGLFEIAWRGWHTP